MPRPRALDEGKQREVCALLTAGMTMGEAAAYVGCCEKTIRREQRRDEGFDERVRRARMAARLGPLQAVREAAATHWRAAAWLVDRQDRQEERERRARREQAKRKRLREKAKRQELRRDSRTTSAVFPITPSPYLSPLGGEGLKEEVVLESLHRELEQEIQQIASARPSQTPTDDAPKSHRRQPGEPVDAAPLPARHTSERPAPVAAAMRELAKQVAATVDQPKDRAASGDSTGDSTRRTKPTVGPAAESAAEPAKQGLNGDGGESSGGGFVPSLRVFGHNDEGGEERAANLVRGAEPAAAAVGCGGDRPA